MKKKSFVSVVTAVLCIAALLLSGCGAKPAAPAAQTEAAPAAEAEAAQTVTLKVGLLGKSIKPVGVLVADSLGYFAEEEIHAMVADFEELYKLHYDAWYKDYKAHGFEVIMHRYAGAIERLKYTAEVIRRYLAGELECIEELEPETLHGEPTKWHAAKEFMYVSGY